MFYEHENNKLQTDKAPWCYSSVCELLNSFAFLFPLFPQTGLRDTRAWSFPSGYSRLNHHKRHSNITRSKISYSLIESQPLSCTPAFGHEFHAPAFHPHPAFTIPLVRHAYWIRSKVCSGAFLWKQLMRLGYWLFSQRSSVIVRQLFLRRFPPLGLRNKRILNSSFLLILLILDRPHFLISLKENLSTEYTWLKTCD